MTEIQKRLFALQDKDYGYFNARLLPTVDRERIIGVRTPALRRLAAELWKEDKAQPFLESLPHFYFEENGLHAAFIEKIRDYDACFDAVERFLPYVDNWATCDSLNPPVFRRHLPELIRQIPCWLASEQTYTRRLGIGMLMRHYLDEAFRPEYPEWVAAIRSEEYYVNMMIAWYFATALAKQYDTALPYLEQPHLDRWTHNKAIQKALESYRITDEQKAYLKTLKRKQETFPGRGI